MTVEARLPARLPYLLIGLAAGFGALIVSQRIGAIGIWPEQVSATAGRAILSVAGKAELGPQLALFPPLPYVLLSLVEWVARPLGLGTIPLATALLAAALLASYARQLRQADFKWPAVVAFTALLALNPLMLEAVARGPQTLLLVCTVWIFGRALFGLRTEGSVNDLLALTLVLPMMALTSVRGAAVAVSAIPFLLLAVAPDLRQRAYASVLLVLTVPLLFAGAFMVALSAMLLNEPFGFVTTDLLETGRWSDRPLLFILAASIAAVFGAGMIGGALIVRARARRPLQAAAGALLGTVAVAVAIQAALGLADSALHALTIVAPAGAAFSVFWPREANRTWRVGTLLLIGWLVAASFAAVDRVTARDPLAALLGGRVDEPPSPDLLLGRRLATLRSVTIDALAHPEVIAARGSADGLVTETTPVFGVSLLARRVFTDHVAVRRHRPGTSDDALSRAMPALYANGPPGYRLTYDNGGWRIWSRGDGEDVQR